MIDYDNISQFVRKISSTILDNRTYEELEALIVEGSNSDVTIIHKGDGSHVTLISTDSGYVEVPFDLYHQFWLRAKKIHVQTKRSILISNVRQSDGYVVTTAVDSPTGKCVCGRDYPCVVRKQALATDVAFHYATTNFEFPKSSGGGE